MEYDPSNSEPPDVPAQGNRGLRRPQFRLSTLLGGIALFCFGLACMKLVSPLFAAVLCLLILAIFAHVAGNAIGTQLRSNGNADLRDADLRGADNREDRTAVEPAFAPPTSLRAHTRLGLTTIIPTAILAFCGGATGAWCIVQFSDTPSMLNIGMATISAAVLGGLFGFWLSSLANIVLEAVVQAHRES